MKKVLILGVSAVQYDSIVILKEMGYETYAIARDAIGPGVKAADHFEPINFVETDRVIEYIKENDIDLVYSTGSDLAMPIASKISEELGLPHFVSYETAKICNNKDLMRETLGSDFYGNVPFQILKEKDEEIKLPYPFIMKPTDSQGQRGVNLINNEEEFDKLFEETKSYSRSKLVIIEKYIGGHEVSVNGYMVDGELKFIEVSDRETWEQYVGLIHKHIVPSDLTSEEAEEKLRKILENTSNKLGIKNGPVYAQVKIDNDEPYIIEITPRLDGCHMWKLINESQDFNLLKLTYEHLLNGNTEELNKLGKKRDGLVLDFLCQEPHTPADYSNFAKDTDKVIASFQYYEHGDNVKPVNNKYEKIGYTIYPK